MAAMPAAPRTTQKMYRSIYNRSVGNRPRKNRRRTSPGNRRKQNIPGRISSVTGMLSVLHLLRNPPASWGCRSALQPVQNVGTIPLNLLRNRNSLRQHELRLRIVRQYLGDRRLRRKLRRGWHRCSLDLHFPVPVHARAGRDQVTDDDVLLESEQLVTRATNRGVGENTRRLLEARRRDKRLGRETGLGDSEQQRLRDRRQLLVLLGLVVRIPEGLLVDVLALEELRVSALQHAHLLQHLPHDHANVLVVDLHALQAVNLLHFVEQVLLNRARSLDAKDIVRIHRAFGETVARSH